MSMHMALTKSVRWAFNVRAWQPTESEFLAASACIQEEEKARIGKLAFRNHAKAALVGQLLMRKFICGTSGVPYTEVKFSRDGKGRPYVLNPVVNFNVSHCGDHVVLAGEEVCTKVGVDVMRLEQRTGRGVEELFCAMSRLFTAQEWENIRCWKLASKQMVAFYRHWCLKESYLKAQGLTLRNLGHYGLKTNEPSLQVGVIAHGTRVYVDGILADNWCFQETLLDEDHCVAVSLSRNVLDCERKVELCSRNLFQFLDFEQLMEGSEPILQPDMEYTINFFTKPEQIIRPLVSCLDSSDKKS